MAGGRLGERALARAEGTLLRGGSRFERRLVWLLGSPRSGSTWLLRLLGEHDAVIPYNEPLIGWFLGPFTCDLPGMQPGELDRSTFTMRRAQGSARYQFFNDEFEHVWRPDLRRMLKHRLLAHAQRYPAGEQLSRSLMVIKEPNGSQSADVIMRALPRSRFLFLLRDGRDVVDSELASNLKGSWISRMFAGSTGIEAEERRKFVEQSAYKWLWRTEVVQEAYAAHTGPKHLVRYEDLIRDPEPHLRGIYDWLGLELSDTELAATIERHAFEEMREEDRGEGQFSRAAKPGYWRESLSEDEQAVLHAVIGPKLRELGYET
jgi:sulfotransferase family protein